MRFESNKMKLLTIGILLIFMIAITFYLISSTGYLNLSIDFWRCVWTIAENGLGLYLCIIVSFLFEGLVKFMLRSILIPFFAIKTLFYISCYTGLYLFSVDTWGLIWTIALIVLILSGLGCCIYYLLINKTE